MRRDKIFILILIVILSAAFIACGKDGEESKAKTWVGTLDSWDLAAGTMTIDGTVYQVAKGLADFADQAEAGKKYEFKTDVHDHITNAVPQ